jgi:hypothetical protein
VGKYWLPTIFKVYSLLSGHPRFPKLCPFNRNVRLRGIFFLICNTYDVYYNLSLVSDYDENETENFATATLFAFDLIRRSWQGNIFVSCFYKAFISEFVDVKSFRLKKKTGFCVTYSLEFHFCKNSPFCL